MKSATPKDRTLGVTIALCHGLVDNLAELPKEQANELREAARRELMDHGYFLQKARKDYSGLWVLRRWNKKATRPTRRHGRIYKGDFIECCKHALKIINTSKGGHDVVCTEELASLPAL